MLKLYTYTHKHSQDTTENMFGNLAGLGIFQHSHKYVYTSPNQLRPIIFKCCF